MKPIEKLKNTYPNSMDSDDLALTKCWHKINELIDRVNSLEANQPRPPCPLPPMSECWCTVNSWMGECPKK